MDVMVPKKLTFLLGPKRYKVAYGGRYGAKSHTIARLLLQLAKGYPVTEDMIKHFGLSEEQVKWYAKPKRVLCTREYQASIKESVHRLLSDLIDEMGLTWFYDVKNTEIVGKNGACFLFHGLKTDPRKIKSLEDVDIAWCEEADKIQEDSWDILKPTIRNDNSEIWISFNTSYDDDYTYKYFVTNKPGECAVSKINYTDLPRDWIPDTVWREIESDKARDEQKYKHIWLGEPVGSGGKVFPGYSDLAYPDGHLQHIPIPDLIGMKARCVMGMDPHSKYYPFCVWVAVIGEGSDKRYHIYNEFPTYDMMGGLYADHRKSVLFNGTMAQLSRMFCALDGTSMGLNLVLRTMDTRFAKGAGGNNWSTKTDGVQMEFARPENGGLDFQLPPEKFIDGARNVIREALDYNHNIPMSVFNSPKLTVEEHCINTRHALRNHKFELDDRRDTEKEDERYKDATDALKIAIAGIEAFGVDYVKRESGFNENDSLVDVMEFEPAMHSLALG